LPFTLATGPSSQASSWSLPPWSHDSMSCLICNEFLYDTITCGLIPCVSHTNTISPPKVVTQLPKPNKDLSLGKDPENTTYNKWFESTTKKEKLSMFYFENFWKNSNWLDWRKKVNYFKRFHSSTAPSFMVDTLNPISAGIARNGLCWYLVLKLCLQ
jgi:hypothetical protein